MEPEETQIVDPRNARSRAYLLELLMLQRLGKCPFCAGGNTLLEDPIIDQNELCWMKHSHTPYNNASTHLVIAPMRHVRYEGELTSAEKLAMDKMLYGYLEREGIEPGGFYMNREGPTWKTGATVTHFHKNYLMPEVVEGRAQIVTVNCGGWSGRPEWLPED